MKKIPLITLPASKSIGNRLLVLSKLFPGIGIDRLPTARDTALLQKALDTTAPHIDIRDAGTAMRFALAYYGLSATQPLTLDGTPRMRRRPVGPLVDALRALGAQIEYLDRTGFPPVRITPSPKAKQGGEVKLDAGISSQFITALMLVAPATDRGIRILLQGKPVSRPYIRMTALLLQQAGIPVRQTGDTVEVRPPAHPPEKTFTLESDWSAAAFFYARTAVTGRPVRLARFFRPSVQGDAIAEKLFENFGVCTRCEGDILHLERTGKPLPAQMDIDCRDFPDLAQPLAVTCFGLRIPCQLTGLQTLRIKETDRIAALENELGKLGARTRSGSDWLEIMAPEAFPDFRGRIHTYNDHRMSMSFAVLQTLFPSMQIDDPGNVAKSYPGFWEDWGK